MEYGIHGHVYMCDSGLQLHGHVYVHACTYVTLYAFMCMRVRICKSSHVPLRVLDSNCLISELFSFESREIEKDSLRWVSAGAQDPGAF